MVLVQAKSWEEAKILEVHTEAITEVFQGISILTQQIQLLKLLIITQRYFSLDIFFISSKLFF